MEPPTSTPSLGENDATIRRWVMHRLAERAFTTMATLLASAAIPLVPSKGIALGRWLYASDSERPLQDVDLLVPRDAFRTCVDIVRRGGYEVTYVTDELGELATMIDGFPVEIHAEFGRRELTALSTAQVIDRAKPDRLFGFDVLRLDDVDHFLLLAVNVIKDGFLWSNPHQPEDLKRMLALLEANGRVDALLARADEAAFVSGLRSVAAWMADEHGCEPFAVLRDCFPRRRRIYSLMAGALPRLGNPPRNVGLLLGCWTNDQLPLRLRATWRLIRRGAMRALARDPDAR